jgi:hypothetical protein
MEKTAGWPYPQALQSESLLENILAAINQIYFTEDF